MISKPVEEFSKQTTSTDSTNVGEEEIHDPIEVATTLAFLIGILQVKFAGTALRVSFCITPSTIQH